MAKSKIAFKVKLVDLVKPEKLDQLTKANQKKVSSELGEFIIDKILTDTGNQRSSVTGQRWKGLSEAYKAKKSRIASPIANMELHGKMLDAIKKRPTPLDVEIGIYAKLQSQKADGHTHSGVYGQSDLPVRKFMPHNEEKLRSGIMKEVVKIAKELVEEAPKRLR